MWFAHIYIYINSSSLQEELIVITGGQMSRSSLEAIPLPLDYRWIIKRGNVITIFVFVMRSQISGESNRKDSRLRSAYLTGHEKPNQNNRILDLFILCVHAMIHIVMGHCKGLAASWTHYNINTVFPGMKISNIKNPSYPHNTNSYTSKMASWYWAGPLLLTWIIFNPSIDK